MIARTTAVRACLAAALLGVGVCLAGVACRIAVRDGTPNPGSAALGAVVVAVLAAGGTGYVYWSHRRPRTCPLITAVAVSAVVIMAMVLVAVMLAVVPNAEWDD